MPCNHWLASYMQCILLPRHTLHCPLLAPGICDTIPISQASRSQPCGDREEVGKIKSTIQPRNYSQTLSTTGHFLKKKKLRHLDFMPPNAPPDSGGPSRSGSLRGLDRRRTQPSEDPRNAPRTRPSFRISRSSTQVSQQAKGPKLQRDTCSSYDLSMDDLRGFLEKRFPECTFEKITVSYRMRSRLPPILILVTWFLS